MIVLDFENNAEYSIDSFPEKCGESSALFISCRPSDMHALRNVFYFDESTVLDCIDIDESVRFTALDGYDFASLVHLNVENSGVSFSEINLYISKKFLILVMPKQYDHKLHALEEKILSAAKGLMGGKAQADATEGFNQLFFLFFSTLASYYSDTLEALEDRMQALSERIMRQVEGEHFEDIQALREAAYAVKKVLRAFSYIGLQILCNENGAINKKKLFLFRNLDTRFRKLCDFSENVYGLSTELLRTYDSKITQKTNDVINKLTFVTLFFGPLTVITGIYGMNFRYMPELYWPLGYPLAMLIMAAVSIVIYVIMKKKRWL